LFKQVHSHWLVLLLLLSDICFLWQPTEYKEDLQSSVQLFLIFDFLWGSHHRSNVDNEDIVGKVFERYFR